MPLLFCDGTSVVVGGRVVRKIAGMVGLVASVMGILAWFGINGPSSARTTPDPVPCSACPSPDTSRSETVDPTPNPTPEPIPPREPEPEPLPATATCEIVDYLMASQIEEIVSVAIDGRDAGTLHLDEFSPSGRLAFTVTAGQEHDYAVSTVTGLIVAGGVNTHRGYGSGTLTCSDGGEFLLSFSDQSTDPWTIDLLVVS